MLQKPWVTNVTKTTGNHISALKEDQTQYKRCIYIRYQKVNTDYVMKIPLEESIVTSSKMKGMQC